MLFLKLDMKDILNLQNNLKPAAEAAMKKAASELTAAIHGHIIESAGKKLKSRRSKYVDSMSFKQVNDSTWLINLDKTARWIEDGVPAHNMLQDLLKSPKAKMSKKGSKYISVPFSHSGGPTQTTRAEQDLIKTIKSELKKRDIPYAKIERDDKGAAKLGKLHSFSINDAPLKTQEGPGQGKGPMGQVRQGNQPNSERLGGGIPFLRNISIYQKSVPGKAGGQSSVKRSIMTFRTASSDSPPGSWEHPGLAKVALFDEALYWAVEEWTNKIVPAAIARLVTTLD